MCLDRCPKACSGDADCDASHGELCCNIGGASICSDAKACPRACNADADCPTDRGEACVQVTLASPQKICAPPQAAVKTCSTDQECGAGDVCCGIYGQAVCLPADRCPKSCSAASQCDNAAGEICCGTLRRLDPTLKDGGLCVNANVVPCPTVCSSSAQCDTQKGEICCDGVCSTTCVKGCDQSSDCDGQVCCQASLVDAPLLRARAPEGYPTGQFGPSASVGASTGTGGDCASCKQIVEGQANHLPLCTPSVQPWGDLFDCGCSACASACMGLCSDPGVNPASGSCFQCLQMSCGSALQSCAQH